MDNPFKKAVESETTEQNSTPETENAEAVDNTDDIEVVDTDNQWQKKYEELNNQYIRLAADFDNFRKRQVQEKEDLLKYGTANILKSLIEVLDNFDRGIKAIETVDNCEKVKECYILAYKNFNDTLTKLGLEQIKAEGEIFDPSLHEAVMQTPTSEKPDQTIISELQKGYKLGDKVLRATLVNVASSEA